MSYVSEGNRRTAISVTGKRHDDGTYQLLPRVIEGGSGGNEYARMYL